jgi:hypothetical protein
MKMLILHCVIPEVFYRGSSDADRLPIKTSGVTDGKMTASSSRLGIYVSTFWENGLPARYLNGPSDTLLNHC